MKIAVIGTGYVGLVSGTCFAESGVNVTCVDIDEKKINDLNNNIIPIYEPGLDVMVHTNVVQKRLKFSTNLGESIQGCEAIFIAVGTPPDEDGSADLKYVLGVAKEIGKNLNNYSVIVDKSTVPVGTAEKVRATIHKELMDREGAYIDFDVASNPEFLKEGDAISDFLKPDRIVVGVDTLQAKEVMRKLYRSFVLNNHPLFFMDILSAEMTKYAANAMLATRISFMNDIANLCDKVGADVDAIRRGIGTDLRIGTKFLYPGIGWGGSCFSKDLQALVKTGEDIGYSLDILKSTISVNERQKSVLFDKMLSYFNGNLTGKNIAVWGLSFKPGTDDMREASSIVLINKLRNAGAIVSLHDPVALQEARRILGLDVEKLTTIYCEDKYEAIEDVDALCIATEWPEYRNPEFDSMEALMKDKVIFDGRNIYEPLDMSDWDYISIGRKPILQ